MRNFLGKVKRGVKKVMGKINDAVNQNVDNQLKKVDKVVEIMTNKDAQKVIGITLISLCPLCGVAGTLFILSSNGKL